MIAVVSMATLRRQQMLMLINHTQNRKLIQAEMKTIKDLPVDVTAYHYCHLTDALVLASVILVLRVLK